MNTKVIFSGIIIIMLKFSNCTLAQQNQSPVINNLRATADTTGNRITISYDLNDLEESDLKVSLKMFNEKGNLVPLDSSSILGDIGFPVRKGSQKKITLLYPNSIKNIQNCAIKVIADDLYKVNIQELVDQVDSVRLKERLASISGERCYKSKKGLAHIEAVKDTIEASFSKSGLQTSRQEIVYKKYLGHNIIGAIPGQDKDSKIYILCAHFDAVEKSPGADDNGSGTVGMLEAMRILSKYKYSNSLVFVGFDLEEEGFIGSQKFMDFKYAKQDFHNMEHGLELKIDGVINFDMIGCYSQKVNSQVIPQGYNMLFPEVVSSIAKDGYRGNFILNNSNGLSKELASKFNSNAGKYVPDLKVATLEVFDKGQYTPELTMSDHGVFWYFNFKAIHIGDGGPTRNFDMDSPKDTIGKVNFSFMSNVVKASLSTLADLAGINHSSSEMIKISLINL